MEDQVLGPLSAEGDELRCCLSADGRVVEVTILLEGAAAEDVLPYARAMKASFGELMRRAREELVREFLPLINQGYRGPTEPPVSTDELLERATLAAVTVHSEGMIDFTFNDDDLLWGHWMTVSRNPAGQWDARMWG